MIQIKNYSESEELADPNQNPLLPKHPFRLLITGASGCGKTNLLLNLIYDLLDFDALYLCAKDLNEPKYITLQEKFTMFDDIEEEDIHSIKHRNKNELLKLFKKFKKETIFCSNLNEMVNVDDLDRNIKNLVVFNDCITDKNQSTILEHFIRGRKKNASVIYLSQSYYLTPINIRKNCNYFIFFKLHNKEIKQIIKEIDGSLDALEFKKIYEMNISKTFDFLFLDINTCDPKMRYRKNFNIL